MPGAQASAGRGEFLLFLGRYEQTKFFFNHKNGISPPVRQNVVLLAFEFFLVFWHFSNVFSFGFSKWTFFVFDLVLPLE